MVTLNVSNFGGLGGILRCNLWNGSEKGLPQTTQKRKPKVMFKSDIIEAVENNQIVYAFTNNGCELVLDADNTEVLLSASGWIRWERVRDFKFRMLSQRETKFTVEEIETVAEDAALKSDYAEGIADWAETYIGPDADDDWYYRN